MTVVPAAAAATTMGSEGPAFPEEVGRDGAPGVESQARLLYAALSACANLHPDPESGDEVGGDDEGGGGGGQRPAILFEGEQDIRGGFPLSNGNGGGAGLPPPMPGSGGWITAENVGEFFDEEGNWRGEAGSGVGGGGGLGEGAGTVRIREEGVGGEDEEGGAEGTEETKWRRTD